MDDLTDLDRAMLALERLHFTRPGSKDAAIRDQFGMTSTRYHQLLDRLIDRPEALAADPVTVNRLRRLRERGARWRRAG
jgi:hypothetical protein